MPTPTAKPDAPARLTPANPSMEWFQKQGSTTHFDVIDAHGNALVTSFSAHPHSPRPVLSEESSLNAHLILSSTSTHPRNPQLTLIKSLSVTLQGCTHSLGSGFGSGMMVPGTGVSLNNFMKVSGRHSLPGPPCTHIPPAAQSYPPTPPNTHSTVACDVCGLCF